ncbi:Fc receptor-like protein 5 [Rana temporaria]|uniref:Fc receptor-like protein 5 n=1 Tax=Rana temporaria TaxID=8407 RepID=UPI001AAD1506|nr:Fc receptor-like protein 5 [Rana temporaria]
MSPKLFVLFILAAVGKRGSAARPVLKFSPNYNPIFSGEKMKMTCDSQPKETEYSWLFNNAIISKGDLYEIPSANIMQSGNYQCQTKDGSKSEMVALNVTEGQLILQTAPYIHEGDRLMLRCHHNPGMTGTMSIFYKNKAELRGWNDDALFTEPGITMNASGSYSCIKKLSWDSRSSQSTASATIKVKELFTVPVISMFPNPPKGGDKVSLKCQATVSTYKPKTELWYAFYKDGENIQIFSPANQCGIPSEKLKPSGKYSCAVTPKLSSVTKKSQAIYLKSSKAALTQNIVGLALYECILIMSFMFIFIT